MSKLDDMTETVLHDRFEGHGFSRVEASGAGLVGEFPFREGDIEMDYRQPGFQLRKVREGVFGFDWPSFVQDFEIIDNQWNANPGSRFFIEAAVTLGKTPHPLLSGEYLLTGAARVTAAAVRVYGPRRSPPEPTPQNKRGQDLLVEEIGSVSADGEFVPDLNFPLRGNLFLSRPSFGGQVRLISEGYN